MRVYDELKGKPDDDNRFLTAKIELDLVKVNKHLDSKIDVFCISRAYDLPA
jgi:hypothetical protein